MKKVISSAALLAILAPASAQAVVDFNYQSLYSPIHTFNKDVMEPWKESLPEFSKGTLQAYTFAAGGLTKNPETLNAIMEGTLDMGTAGLAFNIADFPLSAMLNIPFSTDNAIHATAYLQELYNTNEEVKNGIDKAGKLLAIWGADVNAFFSNVGAIISVADINGKRVLAWSGAQLDQIRALGGIPVQVTPNDTYIALERGMGDLILCPLTTGVANKIMEVSKDVTPIPATTLSIYTWASNDLWDYLSDEEKGYLESSTKDWGTKTGDFLVKSTQADIETMKAAGCTFYELTPEALAEFKELALGSYTAYVQKEFERLGIKKDAQEWVDYGLSFSD